jgi:hypothetical protein
MGLTLMGSTSADADACLPGDRECQLSQFGCRNIQAPDAPDARD